MLTMKTTIEIIKDKFGSVQKLANILNIERQSIYQWPDGITKKRTKSVEDRIEFAFFKKNHPDLFPSHDPLG